MGRGGSSKVYLVENKASKQKFALKKISKERLLDDDFLTCVKNERSILAELDHPLISKLHSAFQTKKCIYFVLDYAEKGELFSAMLPEGRFSESLARRYISEIVIALEYLHSKDIVYADLKPENVLLSADDHVILTDFGLSSKTCDKRSNFGTPEYCAPEKLKGMDSGQAIDWWTLVR